MASYSAPLRKSIRWYKKIAIDMLLNIALINAHVLYHSVNNVKLKITNFRVAILKYFCANQQASEAAPTRPKRQKHVLVKFDPSRKTRRNCGECYKTNVKTWVAYNHVTKPKNLTLFVMFVLKSQFCAITVF